jgi:hypothetical protein
MPDTPDNQPRLPHERDESSDSQNTGDVRGVMQQAHDDVRAGQKDTDRGPVLDRTYQRQKAGGDRSGTEPPANPRKR